MKIKWETSATKELPKEGKKIEGSHASVFEGIYDCSCLKCFHECPFKFHLTYELGLRALENPSALSFGAAVHRALFRWYDSNGLHEAIREFDDYEAEGDEKRSKERGISYIKDYVDFWGFDRQWQVVANEVDFAVEMPNETLFTGRIDLIVKYMRNLYVVDHKTTSSMGVYFFQRFRPDFQLDGYCYATDNYLGECRRFCVNAISTAKSPRDGRFGREYFTKALREHGQWERNYTLTIKAIEWCREEGFYQSYDACSNWGGCRFKPICLDGLEEKRWGENYRVEKREQEDG